MDISLIICTRDRCDRLERCLQAVLQLKFSGSWELIIIDNGSVDNTPIVIQKFLDTSASALPSPVMYANEPRPGKSRACNLGISLARGEILAFTDHDCYPNPDFLARTWDAFTRARLRADYVTGRILLYDPTDEPVTIEESTIARAYYPEQYIQPGAVVGANMAFHRKALRRIGVFDTLFGPGAPFEAAEDIDIASRASLAGYVGRYCPDIVVWHHHERKKIDVPALMRRYGIAVGAYHAKLLLRHHKFAWLSPIIRHTLWRYKWSHRMVFWEPVGALKYIWLWLRQKCRRRRSRNKATGDPLLYFYGGDHEC